MEWNRKKETKIWEQKENKEVPFLSSPVLEQESWLIHGFSTRRGGVSEGFLSSMNLSFTRGDEEDNVRENFRRMAEAIGFEESNLVFSDQTHTVNIHTVTEEDRGKGYVKERDYNHMDGLITDVPGLVLATFYADCVPLYFVDPIKKAIGLSHSGWKGTVGKIGKKTIEAMGRTYGSRPEDIIVVIGPSICQDCYEVSEDVIIQFQEAFKESCWPRLFYKKENGKYQLNLWAANEEILKEAHIAEAHLHTTDICTCCNPGMLYSHRASQGKRGNLAAFLSIKETV